MIVGVILAGGKGSRLKCKDQNKTSLKLNNKPLVQYGVDLFENYCQKTVIVVGAFAESVKQVVDSKQVIYAHQTKRLGTGHAAKVAVTSIAKLRKKPSIVFLGYGDHLMFYTRDVLDQMLQTHQKSGAEVTVVSSIYPRPNELAWGRVVRDSVGSVVKIVEQKDATKAEQKIQEVNAGFYCFNYSFLEKNIKKLRKSPVTGEYYITDLVALAISKGSTVSAYRVPFSLVGTGINTPSQLEDLRAQTGPVRRWEKLSQTLVSTFKDYLNLHTEV